MNVPFFLNLSTLTQNNIIFSHEKNYEPLIEKKLPIELKSNRFLAKSQIFALASDFCVGTGIGREISITPLYQVFKFEQKLSDVLF